MAHDATSVATMKLATKGFSSLIRRVENTSQVGHHDDLTLPPFLDGKVLNINMARARGGSIVIDHIDSCKVVNMKEGGARWEIAKVMQNRAEILGDFGSVYSGNKLSLSGRGSANGLKFRFVGYSTTSIEKGKASDRAAGPKISGMGSVNKANKGGKRVTGKRAKRIIMGNKIKGNNGEGEKRFGAPVDDIFQSCVPRR